MRAGLPFPLKRRLIQCSPSSRYNLAKHYPFGGPDPLSFMDVVAIYERVLGHAIPVRHVPPKPTVAELPAPVAGVLAAMDTYDSPIDTTETAREFGIRLTPLEEVVRRAIASAVVAPEGSVHGISGGRAPAAHA